MLLPWQPKEQYISLNVTTETAIIAHVETIWKMYNLNGDIFAVQID